MKNISVLMLGLLVIVGPLRVGSAENYSSAATESSTSTQLTEIVVTAEKRAEEIDKVPISIAAFSPEEMDKQLIVDMADVANKVPGVDYVNQGAFNVISIRGITSSGGAPAAVAGYPTTAIYIDDVPVAVRTTAGNEWNAIPKVFDLQQVEVLRGPQGTLYGAGAEGGMIQFITPQPSLSHSSGYARAGFASTDNGGVSYETGGAYGAPIIDDELGFRVSAWHRRDGGYIQHESAVADGFRYGDSNWTDSDVLRGAVTYAPTSALTITPSIYYQHIYYHDTPEFTPAEGSGANDAYTNALTGLGIPYSNIKSGLLVDPVYRQEPITDRFYLPALKLEYQAPFATLTSSTSYMYRSSSTTYDWSSLLPVLIGLPWPRTAAYPMPFIATLGQNIFTQEVRLQSGDSQSVLQWTAGAYFARQKESTVLSILAPTLSSLLQSDGFGSVESYLGSGLLPGGGVYYGSEPDTIDTQRALFGEGTLRITKWLSAVAGVRVANNSTTYSNFQTGPLIGGGVISFHRSVNGEHPVDPKFGINVQLDDRTLVYASASRGDRIGGVNTFGSISPGCTAQIASFGYANGVPPTYQSDSLWSYELGAKSRLMDDRLQLEASTFHIKWSNIQQAITFPACASGFTTNLGSAFSNGFDLQAKALVTRDLTLGVSAGYTNARDAETLGVVNDGVFVPSVQRGQQINPYASPWTLEASAEYGFVVAGTHHFYIRAYDTFHSRNPGPYQATTDVDNPAYKPYFRANPSTNQLDLHFGTTVNSWDLSLYALNLLNTHPLLYDQEFNSATEPATALTLRPLTLGVSVAWRQ